MGNYLDPGNGGFREARNSEIYVDKSEMIAYTNRVICTEQKNICISRPRRFGKSMAVQMLVAYYTKKCDSSELFYNLKIAASPSYKKYLNQYHVIALNMQEFLSETHQAQAMIEKLQNAVCVELQEEFGELAELGEETVKKSLPDTLNKIYSRTGEQFVFAIDEWDCIFREKKENAEGQRQYLDFLRNLLKDRRYVALSYMTGILPVKKYGSHSALNMFSEFSMTNPRIMAEYVGFTEEEVKILCERYQMDFAETARWYDGYTFRRIEHVYSPKSVVDAMLNEEFDSYWTQTETYEALRIYIEMNYDGLKDAIIEMLAGNYVKINTATFENDMTTFRNKDDVLTLLVHLGYLAYNAEKESVFIPNYEVSREFANALQGAGWNRVVCAIQTSETLLEYTWDKRADKVADELEKIHLETSILTYNNENALACLIALAYYSAKVYYTETRECPAGEGFADIVYMPRKNHLDKPAMIVELKWDKSAQGAITQIKDWKYINALKDFKGKVLLVGISYHRKNKTHECVIEEMEIII